MFVQSYNRLTGIILALFAGHHLHRLHAFDEWRERVALQVEPMRDGIEGQTVLLPEHHQYQISGMTSKSAFIKARIFSEPFHVVTFDKSLHEYYTKLSDFHAQFRMVGNNYNQTLKELKYYFSERRAMALVCKLEKYMMKLVQIMSKVTELTNEYKERVNSKKIEDKSNFSTQHH